MADNRNEGFEALSRPSLKGENVDSKLESWRQEMPKAQSKDYEITIPFLLNGERWRPGKDIYSQRVRPLALWLSTHQEIGVAAGVSDEQRKRKMPTVGREDGKSCEMFPDEDQL
ncbi:hypothetical protein WISP_44166 [Willisornis vidua]|uniref:Uncharacterized protein n=1 Tax=Willisornis vidua TaxID=1566151 RepID=A0ABQ9DIR1_9PASS|nr:hypothetical protein WISP_44166 [Willisornis vidua]